MTRLSVWACLASNTVAGTIKVLAASAETKTGTPAVTVGTAVPKADQTGRAVSINYVFRHLFYLYMNCSEKVYKAMGEAIVENFFEAYFLASRSMFIETN